MSEERKVSTGGLVPRAAAAAAASAVFLGLAWATSAVLSAVIVVPVGIAVASVWERREARAVPHVLSTPAFSDHVQLRASRAGGPVGGGSAGTPSAA
ncbi:MAG: hypothetical protein ABR511_09555 [Acidimicrobiales bacterium]